MGASMHLTPREQEKLLIYTAGQLAADRMKRGLKLNHPEAVAYLTAAVLEGIREGQTVSELMTYGTYLLVYDDVMPVVPEMIPQSWSRGHFGRIKSYREIPPRSFLPEG